MDLQMGKMEPSVLSLIQYDSINVPRRSGMELSEVLNGSEVMVDGWEAQDPIEQKAL